MLYIALVISLSNFASNVTASLLYGKPWNLTLLLSANAFQLLSVFLCLFNFLICVIFSFSGLVKDMVTIWMILEKGPYPNAQPIKIYFLHLETSKELRANMKILRENSHKLYRAKKIQAKLCKKVKKDFHTRLGGHFVPKQLSRF